MRRLAFVVLYAALLPSCGPDGDLLVARPIDGYRVVYRVVDAEQASTEVVEVRRPYGGRVETRINDETTTGRITSREHFWQLGEDARPQFGVLRPPGGPPRDASFAALLHAARAGVVEDRIGHDRILGRRCRWFAYRDPAPEPLRPPTADSRVESCVSDVGIVLREVWTLKGKPGRIIEAVDLELGAPPKKRFMDGKDPSSTEVTTPKGAEFLETQTRVVDVASGKIETPFSFEEPDGWERDRVSIVGITAGQGARPTQFLSQAFLRKGELVVLETGSSPQLAPPWPTDEGRRVRIGAGEGRMVHRIDRVEIRVLSAIGYARVMAPSEALARTFIARLGD